MTDPIPRRGTPLLPADHGELSRPEAAIADLAARALAARRLSEEEASELVALFGTPPPATGSGLDDTDARSFVESAVQAIEVCVAGGAKSHTAFVNAIVQRELDRAAAEDGLEASVLENICDLHRCGSDRRYIFGQVKERPDDPDDPSFFGGLWPARCASGELRRVLFSIHAEAAPESVVVRPHEASGAEARALGARVRARGPHPWKLQVAGASPLGRWIAGLCGTDQIGQIRGQLPLGVLGDAVCRALEPRAVTHLLLGASRRDPPSRPWHTGAFLRPLATPGEFRWNGIGLDAETGALVDTLCTVRTRARIHRLERID